MWTAELGKNSSTRVSCRGRPDVLIESGWLVGWWLILNDSSTRDKDDTTVGVDPSITPGDTAIPGMTSPKDGDLQYSPDLQYSQAWWGLINEGEKNQLGAIIAKAVKQGFLAPDQPTFQEICDSADVSLFRSILQNSDHVLHQLLPPVKIQNYSLRERAPQSGNSIH